MDIVVTVPKTESEREALERRDAAQRGLFQFWPLARSPTRLRPGDRVYFVRGGLVSSSMRVVRIRPNLQGTRCLTTGRVWVSPVVVIMDDDRDEPGPPASSFRGFRYRWWEGVTKPPR